MSKAVLVAVKRTLKKPLLVGLFLAGLAMPALGQELWQYTRFRIDFRSGDVLDIKDGEPERVKPMEDLHFKGGDPFIVEVTGEDTAAMLLKDGSFPLGFQRGVEAITLSEPVSAGYAQVLTIFNAWQPKYHG